MSDATTQCKERDGVKHDDVTASISNRHDWAQRQAVYEQMRTDGVRRARKPWPHAADMHFPLADMQIEKNKPYYIEQVFGRELLASFTAMTKELTPQVAAVERWFDWQLKQRTNFAEFVELATDKMMMAGREPVRVLWNADKQRVVFEALDPVKVIVPPWTKKIQEADWIVHVMEYSKFAYKRNTNFRQEPEFVARICGKGADDDQQSEDTKRRSEGLTYSGDDDTIIIWELYVQTADGWRIHTYSPVCPHEDVRPPRGLPYTEGVFSKAGGCLPPFAQLSAELRNERWLSPRGIPQRIAPFEASLNSDWNALKDFQQLTTNPLFAAPNGLGANPGNIRFTPGQILPFALNAVSFPSPPSDIGQGMASTRSVAEQLIGTPDFGLGASAQAPGAKGPKTATEVQALGTVMGAGIGMRGRRFRAEMSVILGMAWSLYIQYGKASLDYYTAADGVATLEENALSGGYTIQLAGTGEDTRMIRLQKAYQRMQTFGQNPMINQRELTKSVLEEDDPGLVRRLLLDQDTQMADQAEDQASEIGIMLIGYPAQVKPTDNHAVHLQVLGGYMQRRLQLNERMTSEMGVLFASHALQHFESLKQQNPQAAQQFAPMAEEWQGVLEGAQAALQAQAQQQQAQAAPGGMAQ